LSPGQLAAILSGGLFLTAIGVAIYLDWQKAKEAEDARRAQAYYEGWKDGSA
jgi:hypothetical protein